MTGPTCAEMSGGSRRIATAGVRLTTETGLSRRRYGARPMSARVGSKLALLLSKRPCRLHSQLVIRLSLFLHNLR